MQRQFVAVDNDRVARGATRAQLTVRRPRRPLQRTLTLVWREEIIGWTKGGGGSRAVIIMITIASSSCRSKDMTEFLFCRWKRSEFLQTSSKKCVSVSCVSVVER